MHKNLIIPEELVTRVPEAAMRATVEDLFKVAGLSENHARQATDVLMWADLRGIDSHGVSNMMSYYLAGLKGGSINATPVSATTHEAPATATIDSDRGLGLVAGPDAMRLAMAKARVNGIGAVTVGNGRHFGAAGYFAALALEEDMIGMAMTVGGLLVAPTFGSKAMVGLNPLAFAAPTLHEAPFVFDASMSSVAANKIRLARRLNAEVPGGWIAGTDGTPIMQDTEVPEQFLMLPAGATRDIGSHKGYSLAVMVDILSGLLAGTGPGFSTVGTTSHHFVAYNVSAFTDVATFKQNMDDYMKALRETPPAPGHDRVMYAGLGQAEFERDRRTNGIPYHKEVVAQYKLWAAEYGILDRFA